MVALPGRLVPPCLKEQLAFKTQENPESLSAVSKTNGCHLFCRHHRNSVARVLLRLASHSSCISHSFCAVSEAAPLGLQRDQTHNASSVTLVGSEFILQQIIKMGAIGTRSSVRSPITAANGLGGRVRECGAVGVAGTMLRWVDHPGCITCCIATRVKERCVPVNILDVATRRSLQLEQERNPRRIHTWSHSLRMRHCDYALPIYATRESSSTDSDLWWVSDRTLRIPRATDSVLPSTDRTPCFVCFR